MNRKWIYFLIFTVLVLTVHNLLALEFPVVAENKGISFGLTVSWIFFVIIFFLIIGFIILLKNWSWGLVLIIAAGFSNLVERIIFGYVRDYWYLGFNVYNNLNDWLIGIGVLLFLVEVVWKKELK